VLGKYPERIQEALDSGGVFFDPGEEVLRRLEKIGVDPWRLEEAFLRQQDAAGMRFDLTLRGFPPDEAERLVEALPLLADGKVTEALLALQADRLPSYALEAQWLLQRGYAAKADLLAGWVHWEKP
jgi:hypothetical protein